uniref:uncharacterized protein LOC117694443 n=1 Tax=Arvicanthis niloticus TaxID=61156 RepID=UPI00402B23AE
MAAPAPTVTDLLLYAIYEGQLLVCLHWQCELAKKAGCQGQQSGQSILPILKTPPRHPFPWEIKAAILFSASKSDRQKGLELPPAFSDWEDYFKWNRFFLFKFCARQKGLALPPAFSDWEDYFKWNRFFLFKFCARACSSPSDCSESLQHFPSRQFFAAKDIGLGAMAACRGKEHSDFLVLLVKFPSKRQPWVPQGLHLHSPRFMTRQCGGIAAVARKIQIPCVCSWRTSF